VTTTLTVESARVGPIDPPGRSDLEAVFRLKYGDPETTGWGPRMRWRFGYFNPDEHYEATVDRLVTSATRWLDVGCGRELFPSNRALARQLSDRARRLVGIDPDVTLEENPFVHEKVRLPLDEYQTDERFDLVTLRMVAEHVADPERVAGVLGRIVAPGGLVVVFTVHRFAPVPLLTSVVPFRLRHPVKRFLWRTEEKDTFPTCFRMNTRHRLARLMSGAGFEEARFELLDDCRSLARFKAGLWSELTVRRALAGVGLGYPERCVLGVYRRRGAG